MFIILRKEENIEKVINIIYGENESIVKKWVTGYLVDKIERLSVEPLLPDTKNTSYIVTDEPGVSNLIRKYKKVNRGYMYNSSDKVEEIVCSVRFLEFDGILTLETSSVCGMWSDLNVEINNRVLKRLDKESLYQVMNRIQLSVYAKSIWNKDEYTGMVAEIIKDFKKELYSNVAKKMNRFGKKQIESKSKCE